MLSGIPKNLYDLNDKRRLSHALCIRYCTCTVIPIKLLAGFSSVRDRAEEDMYTRNGRDAEQEEKTRVQKIDQANQATFSDH